MIKPYSRKILRRFLIKLGIREPKNHIRKDVEIIPIQPNLELIVYWKVLKIGKGPAVILQAHEKEILKFDCFGKDDGHFHAAPDYDKRIFFDEETVLSQIERIARELTENAEFYLNIQKDDLISEMKINRKKLSNAVDRAKKKMIYFLQTVPELKDLR